MCKEDMDSLNEATEMFGIDDGSSVTFDLFSMFMFKLFPKDELEVRKEDLLVKYQDVILKSEK